MTTTIDRDATLRFMISRRNPAGQSCDGQYSNDRRRRVTLSRFAALEPTPNLEKAAEVGIPLQVNRDRPVEAPGLIGGISGASRRSGAAVSVHAARRRPAR